MKRLISICAALLMTVSAVNFVYADESLSDMTPQEQADTAGAYIGEIIKYIQENYVGSEVDTESLIHAAIKAVVGELDDYSDYLTPEEYKLVKESERTVWYAPEFTCDFSGGGYPVIAEIPNTSKAYQDGIRQGDEIRSIKDVSSYAIGEEEYTASVTSDIAESIAMKIARGDTVKEYSINLVRNEFHSVTAVNDMTQFNTKSQKFNDASVGYIKISTFTNNTSEDFTRALNDFTRAGKTKLILDLRGNTGGYVEEAISVAQQIVPSGIIITARDKKGNITTYRSELKTKPYEKCVVLVDSLTASAAEIVASAMQDSGAGKVVGEQTYGKGVMQSVMSFDDIGVVKMTTMEYSSRYGKKINGIGITPDVTVDKILFVSEDDDLNSENVISAIRFLGFRVDENNTVERNIGRYQAEMGLDVTYKLDSATVSAMNYEIYTELVESDRVLAVGYINLLG
ncbi:MAG: S41 family peptidase [Clostridia bacterium]|nr:S41 family peptidase [Clostridia bacterium]